jgi:hypothetical protein
MSERRPMVLIPKIKFLFPGKMVSKIRKILYTLAPNFRGPRPGEGHERHHAQHIFFPSEKNADFS